MHRRSSRSPRFPTIRVPVFLSGLVAIETTMIALIDLKSLLAS
jgi:hypothetical protein